MASMYVRPWMISWIMYGLADKSFYYAARWSGCRVTIHSGREIRFDAGRVGIMCRSVYQCDNETCWGVERCLCQRSAMQALAQGRIVTPSP